MVYFDADEPLYVLNPDREPSQEELNACPDYFACYCCGEKHPLRELGGQYHERWFCYRCIPYIDDWTAGAMVWWEMKRKNQHPGKHIVKSGNTKLEKLSRLLDAVNWAERKGLKEASNDG
ncbi:MAG: hypothetical protein PHC43_00295 [Candidatus Marinimicrobia bacterium]|nr:hypothetical protein [Candidatus Neomarinimicrobiota bacterium]